MSLERRVYQGSILLATSCLRATNRDVFQLFSPSSFRWAHARAPYKSWPAKFLMSQVSAAHTAPPTISDPVQEVKEAQNKLRQYPNTPKNWSSTNRSIENTVDDKANLPIERTLEHQAKPAERSTIEANRHVGSFKTLEEALSRTRKSLQDSFKLEPARIRRMKTDASRKRDMHERNSFITKYTGSWSYDWRLAFFELKQHYQADNLSTTEPQPFRYCLAGEAPRYRQVRAQDIPRPMLWSSLAFTAYVEDLAQSEVSRLMQRHVYLDGPTHTDAVNTAIMLLFEDESLRPYATTKAFHIALSFYYKINNISSVRKLFNLMNKTDVSISAETFNIMLCGAAAKKDLHNFTYLLRVMTRMGLSPNGDTWIAFLMVLKDKRAKLLTTRYMKEAAMLENAAMLQPVVGQIIDIELASHLAGGQNLESFVLLMDSRYGLDWLSVRTGNQICHILGENGSVSQAVEVLGVMADRGCRPNNVTLHIFLEHCRRLRQVQRALEILQVFERQFNVTPRQDEFESLFMLVWRTGRINCCRAVWRAACLEAAVSYRMQQLVLRSLLRNTPEHPKTTTQRFIKAAGKVIAGIDIDLNTNSVESSPDWKIMQLLSHFSTPGDNRNRSLKLAKHVLARDLDATRHYHLVGSFADLFAEALARDKSWNDNGIQDKPILWKVQHAVDVRVSVHIKPTSLIRTVKS